MDEILACMLGGAVGDALGEPIEFLSIAQIRDRHGEHGITGPIDAQALHASDDTQMTLFTAEGLVLAHEARGARTHPASRRDVARHVHDAYQRWLRELQRQLA